VQRSLHVLCLESTFYCFVIYEKGDAVSDPVVEVHRGSRGTAYSFLTSALVKVSREIRTPAGLNLGKNPRFLLNRKLGRPHSW
jgi:hypothetical protein